LNTIFRGKGREEMEKKNERVREMGGAKEKREYEEKVMEN
jgi:hypothetical protein